VLIHTREIYVYMTNYERGSGPTATSHHPPTGSHNKGNHTKKRGNSRLRTACVHHAIWSQPAILAPPLTSCASDAPIHENAALHGLNERGISPVSTTFSECCTDRCVVIFSAQGPHVHTRQIRAVAQPPALRHITGRVSIMTIATYLSILNSTITTLQTVLSSWLWHMRASVHALPPTL
jgi:hypothetical protein